MEQEPKELTKELNTLVNFTPIEEKIFNLLRDFLHERLPDTTPRVVGGWLRDKLLGLESDDIDISLDNISGLKFAKMVQEYMIEKGLATEKESKVMENPAQSEHLETATMMIFGLEIDLVKLRKETYNEKNRIPELSPGTPLDDALRRDLTMNALFYELKGNKIEDLTGKGI